MSVQKLQEQYDKVDEAIYSPCSINNIINEIRFLTDLLLDKLK